MTAGHAGGFAASTHKETPSMREPAIGAETIQPPRPKHEIPKHLESCRIVGTSHREPGEAWPRMRAISKANPACLPILSDGQRDAPLIEGSGCLRPPGHGDEHGDGFACPPVWGSLTVPWPGKPSP